MPSPDIPATAFTLYDLSGSLTTDNEFRDIDASCAYYCQIVKSNPISTKITRLPDWARTSPEPRREPWTAWLYFTSNEIIEGFVKIGTNAEPAPMENYVRRRSPRSS